MNENISTSQLLEESRVVPDQAARFSLHSARDALQPQEPVEWVVDKLLSAGSLSLVVGEGGSKKTYAMLDLCVALASGGSWLNFPARASPVLVIDEESGNRRLARRLGDTLRGHAAAESTPLFYVSLAAFDFGSTQDINQLQVLIQQTSARLVLIDALVDVMPGRDENSVQFVQPVFLALRRVAETTRAAIVLIHHSNKAGGYRGSTAIKGAVDLMLQVESQPESALIEFKTEKARDTEPANFTAEAHFEPQSFYLTPGFGFQKNVSRLSKAQEYVIRYLSANPHATMADIRVNCEPFCAERTAENALRSLYQEKMEYLKRTDSGPQGGRGLVATYALTQKGVIYAETHL